MENDCRGRAGRVPSFPNVSSVPDLRQAKAVQRGGAGGRAGNMRQCLLFLTSLVPFVLAPRPPDEPGFGSPQRLGKDPRQWAQAGAARLERAALGEAPGRSIRCLGAGCWTTVARPEVFSV